jgi:hypothetical protein
MQDTGLIAFWIKSPYPHAPVGFGVTAWSLEDALQIIHAMGFGQYLPDDRDTVSVVAGVTVSELDQRHVAANMGPIVVRGMWYPFVTVGLPQWATECLGKAQTRFPKITVQ